MAYIRITQTVGIRANAGDLDSIIGTLKERNLPVCDELANLLADARAVSPHGVAEIFVCPSPREVRNA